MEKISVSSRERILDAINHKESERLPIDFGSSTSTGISIFAYSKLQDHLKMDLGSLPYLYDVFLMLADPTLAMIDYMGGDIIQLKRYAHNFGIPLTDWKEWQLPNGPRCMVPEQFNPTISDNGLEILGGDGQCVAKMPSESYHFELTKYPYNGIETASQIGDIEFSRISDLEIAFLKNECEQIKLKTDKAIMFPIYGRVFEAGMLGWGFEEWLVNLMTNEQMVHRYMGELTECHLEDLTKVLDACGEYIDILRFVDDLGTQSSQIMSLEMYRELIKPYHEQMFSFLKKNYPKQKIALHCCGAIKPFLPDFIEMGVDIINPVQISATGMDPKILKKEFGDDITFWGGGVDMQFEVLTEDLGKLKDHVKQMIDTFGPGGGFIFAPTHNVQADIAPEKIVTIYDTAKMYKK